MQSQILDQRSLQIRFARPHAEIAATRAATYLEITLMLKNAGRLLHRDDADLEPLGKVSQRADLRARFLRQDHGLEAGRCGLNQRAAVPFAGRRSL